MDGDDKERSAAGSTTRPRNAAWTGEGKDKDRITKDYRKILDCKDVDAVLIATPDHWHAKMSIDAMEAGKDVYCEKPMTHTIDEARRVAETVKKTKQVFTVGVQSTADPRWRMANQMITEGKIGHVMQGQTSYYRNSNDGQWRYYHLYQGHEPQDGRLEDVPGDRVRPGARSAVQPRRYAQWRCYWDFGGGMYTDLFVHQLTHLILAMGVRFPARVVGAGGLYLEYDGRDVPDMATVVADYDEGCQVLISATMCNDVQLGEVIRGHTATIMFEPHRRRGFPPCPAGLQGQSGPSGRQQGRRRREVHARAARRGHTRLLGALPRVHPFAQPRDPLPGRARLRGDHDGQSGRPVVPRRQGLLLRQGDRQGFRRRPVMGGPLGRAQQTPRQAQPGHRLEGRRQGSLLIPPDYRSSKATGSTARTPQPRPDGFVCRSSLGDVVRPRSTRVLPDHSNCPLVPASRLG